MAGLAAVVAASPWLFWTIRLAGAAYLVYLAWGAWHAPVSVGQTQAERINLAVLLRRGVIMNVTNPKVHTRKLAFDESPAVRRAVCVEPKDLTNEERIAFYGDDPERLIDYVENLQELPATTDFIRLLLADPDPAVVQHTTRQIQDLIVEAVNNAEDFEDEDEEDCRFHP